MFKFLETKLKNFNPRFSSQKFKWTLGGMLVSSIIIPLALVALPYSPWFNDMAVQPKGKAQGDYGWLYGRHLTVERQPPEGSIPRDYTPYPVAGNDPCSVKRAEQILKNPTSPTIASLQRGRELFDTHCYVCHGKTGMGDGPVIGPERFTAPPSYHTEAARNYSDARIYHIISKGQNIMAGYEFQIQQDERWAVVNYIRVLQRAQNPTLEDLRKFKSGDMEAVE